MNQCEICGYVDDAITECDNDCGTIYCEKCRQYYYYDNSKPILGHNPRCGLDSDEESS